MKEITLYDLRVLVESLEDEKVPIVQSDHKTLVDDGVREIQENVKDLYKEIKENQKKIDEQKSVEEKALLEESVKKLPDLKEQKSDPLLSDKIDSLAELQANQKLLISRLQRQLGSLGGGGEVRLEFLDDVDRDSVKVDGKLLSYHASTGKFIGVTGSGVGTESSINTSGIITASGFVGDGSGLSGITASGTGIIIREDGTLVGTIGTINFGTNLSVSNASAGVVTVTASGVGTESSINTSGIITAASFVGDGSGLTGIANTAIINSNQINVTGVVTASSFVGNGSGLTGIANTAIINSNQINVTGVVTAASFVGDGSGLTGIANTAIINSNQINVTGVVTASSFIGDGSGLTGIANTAIINSNQINVTGVVTASSFIGDGSGLTGIANTAIINSNQINVTGVVTASSLDAAISEWVLGADGSSNYTFTGPGLTGAENDPSLYLIRGQKYNFKNSSGGHPFRIQSTPNGSTGTQYNDGVTNNDAGNGTTLIWDVQFDAPEVLYYQCTSHSSMGGKIYIGNSGESIVIGSAVTINSSGINVVGVITATSFDGVPEGTNILKAMLFV